MTTVGVGWLRGTIRTSDKDAVLDLLRPWFGEASERPVGVKWYRASATLADRRVTVGWDGAANNAGTVMVDITQSALDALGWGVSLELVGALAGAGFRASRVDLYLDDRERRASARVVRSAVVEGHYVSHAQPGEYREDFRTGANTMYVGSRESERFLRVYDKDPSGEDPRTRWEVEYKGDTARLTLDLLRAGQDDARRIVTGLLLAFIDFRERDQGERGDRAPRLAWWAALVEDCEKVRGVVAAKVDSLARRLAWLRRQVAPTVAAIWARPEYGNGWLNELLSDGLDRAGGLPWVGAS